MIIRKTFPQVYALANGKTGGKYYMVSARSKKWGLDERRAFPTEAQALDYARQIAGHITANGATPAIPKDQLELVEKYKALGERLQPYGKTPEQAVEFYLSHLGNQILRQAKPFISALVEEWESKKLASKIKPLSKRTIPELKQYARYIRRTWGNNKADDITRDKIENALNALPVKNRNTHKKYLRYIRMFFIWLKDHKRITDNPTDGIKIKGESYEAAYYHPDTIKSLLQHITTEHKDLIGYYSLLVFAGLRPSEGARVQWQDIDFNTGELYVRKGKKESRRFILHPTALDWLRYHKEQSAKDTPFIPLKNLTNREKQVRKFLQGEWIQDGLRHGMATYYNALLQDPYKVAAVLGDNIQTIKRHYMRAVAANECKAFWALTPSNI
jgi:integrase